jgi:hypothetical protein
MNSDTYLVKPVTEWLNVSRNSDAMTGASPDRAHKMAYSIWNRTVIKFHYERVIAGIMLSAKADSSLH